MLVGQYLGNGEGQSEGGEADGEGLPKDIGQKAENREVHFGQSATMKALAKRKMNKE